MSSAEYRVKITYIEDAMQHKISEVMCVYCGHRWIAVRPKVTMLKQLECPRCRARGGAFETGEEISDDTE